MDTQQEIYQNLIKSYQKTGKIGRVRCYNMEHAKRVAYCATQNIIKQKNKSHLISSPSREGTEPFTGCQPYEQLRLFSGT